jgi:zinc protease
MLSGHPIDKSGQFMIFAITNPANMPKVEATIGEEVTKFLKEGVSADELEQAKKAYLQSLKQQRASDASLAASLAINLYADRTFAFQADLEKRIDALQPGDLKRTFDALLDPAKLVIVEAGDFKK